MSREGALMVMVGVAVVLLLLMLWGWKRRSKRDSGLTAPTAVVEGEVRGEFDGFYVATTESDRPLNRLAIKHLAFRSRAHIAVTSTGVHVELPGEPTIFFARESIKGVGRATWTIDRVVEKDGLVYLSWKADEDTIADSYFRLQDSLPDDLVQAIDELISPARQDVTND